MGRAIRQGKTNLKLSINAHKPHIRSQIPMYNYPLIAVKEIIYFDNPVTTIFSVEIKWRITHMASISN